MTTALAFLGVVLWLGSHECKHVLDERYARTGSFAYRWHFAGLIGLGAAINCLLGAAVLAVRS